MFHLIHQTKTKGELNSGRSHHFTDIYSANIPPPLPSIGLHEPRPASRMGAEDPPAPAAPPPPPAQAKKSNKKLNNKQRPLEFGLKTIIDMRITPQSKREFLCRWHDHDPDFATWEPEAFLPEAMVRTYLDKQTARFERARSKQNEFTSQLSRQVVILQDEIYKARSATEAIGNSL